MCLQYRFAIVLEQSCRMYPSKNMSAKLSSLLSSHTHPCRRQCGSAAKVAKQPGSPIMSRAAVHLLAAARIILGNPMNTDPRSPNTRAADRNAAEALIYLSDSKSLLWRDADLHMTCLSYSWECVCHIHMCGVVRGASRILQKTLSDY